MCQMTPYYRYSDGIFHVNVTVLKYSVLDVYRIHSYCALRNFINKEKYFSLNFCFIATNQNFLN